MLVVENYNGETYELDEEIILIEFRYFLYKTNPSPKIEINMFLIMLQFLHSDLEYYGMQIKVKLKDKLKIFLILVEEFLYFISSKVELGKETEEVKVISTMDNIKKFNF